MTHVPEAPQAPQDEAFSAGLSKAALPYGGTSGLGGSDASREARLESDRSGETLRDQRATLTMLGEAGAIGLTIRELGQRLSRPERPVHHGMASSVLSVLHKDGKIARLATVRRGRQSVYVDNEHVNGRAVAKHGGKGAVQSGATKGLTLNQAESALATQFIARARAQSPDKPMWVSAQSARALADLLERALGQVR